MTGELQGELSAICGTGIYTNAVDTGINATPDAFTFMGWYLVNKSDSSTHNFLCGKSMNANGRMQFNECNGALRFWMGGGSDGKTNEEFIVANCMPVGNGFFMWNKGANMPMIDGPLPLVDSGTKIIFR